MLLNSCEEGHNSTRAKGDKINAVRRKHEDKFRAKVRKVRNARNQANAPVSEQESVTTPVVTQPLIQREAEAFNTKFDSTDR